MSITCQKCKTISSDDEQKFCKNCGASLTAAAVKKSSINTAWIVVALILLAMLAQCGKNNNSSPTSNDDVDLKKIGALNQCEKEIAAKSLSPSTAKFDDSWGGKLERVKELTPNVFKVRHWVDLQNAFGATIRYNYACKMTWVSDGNYNVEYADTYRY